VKRTLLAVLLVLGLLYLLTILWAREHFPALFHA
jgi:hypothetical protein